MVKNKIVLSSLLIIIAAGIFYSFRQKTSTSDSNSIIVGTNAEFPPFTFIDKQGTITGFDIDLATEVIKRLGKTMSIKDRSFDMLIPEAQQGSIHLIAAGMTATPERAQNILFTKPYLKGEPLVIVTLKKNPITRLEDLTGKEVVVNEGYTADSYISSIKGPLVKRLPAPAEAMLEVQTEKSFAYVSALNAVMPFIKQLGAEQFALFTIPGTQENTAMAISKKYPELLEKIQPILDAMEHDGTIAQLKQKWNLQ